MEWWLRRRYLVLLLALVFSLVIFPLLRDTLDEPFLADAMLTIVFVAAFRVVFAKKRWHVLAVLLGIPPLVGLWTGYVLPGLPRPPLAVGFHLCAAVFLSFAVATILGSILGEKVVTADSIYGAFSGYLLAGLAFGHLYCVVEIVIPGSFRVDASVASQLQVEHHRHFLLSYFSFITLTTVGYGDVVPIKAAARGLTIVEAIIGQFYIAVLIAELIGKRVAHALTSPQSEPKSSG
ncbi:MAG TPA: potassium channel family protein [Gemmataceae bacterium]